MMQSALPSSRRGATSLLSYSLSLFSGLLGLFLCPLGAANLLIDSNSFSGLLGLLLYRERGREIMKA